MEHNAIQQKIQSQLRKGILDFIILSDLKDGPKYPREIISDLSKAGLEIVEGTLYPLFLRLAKQNLVSYEWKEAGGHPRKYYKLTKFGERALNIYKDEWSSLTTIITNL